MKAELHKDGILIICEHALEAAALEKTINPATGRKLIIKKIEYYNDTELPFLQKIKIGKKKRKK